MTIEVYLDQSEDIKKLEKEKEFMLRLLKDLEEVATGGVLDIGQMIVAIKSLRNQIETGVIHTSKIEPGLAR